MYSLAVTKEYIVCGTYENQVQVTHLEQFPKIASGEKPKPKFLLDHSQMTQIIQCAGDAKRGKTCSSDSRLVLV